MEHGLSAVGAGVGDQPVAAFCDPLFLGKFTSNRKKMSHQRFIFSLKRAYGFDMLVRDEQDVRGRDRVNIPKGSHLFVAMDDFSFGFLGNDLTENTGIGHV